MKILFDDERPKDPKALERKRLLEISRLKTELISNKSRRSLIRTNLNNAVKDVHALDGVSGWFSKLTGTHEQRVEEALQAVKECKDHFNAINSLISSKEEQLKELERHNQELLQTDEAEFAYLESLAEEQSIGGSPRARHIAELGTVISTLQAQLPALTEAFERSASVMTTLQMAKSFNDSSLFARQQTYDGESGDIAQRLLSGGASTLRIHEALSPLPDRVNEFQSMAKKPYIRSVLPMIEECAVDLEPLKQHVQTYLSGKTVSGTMLDFNDHLTTMLDHELMTVKQLNQHIGGMRGKISAELQAARDERVAAIRATQP